MKEKFVDIKFRADTLRIVRQANGIIDEYIERGLKLTLRQLFYQFVSRDLLPNKQTEYKRLGSIIDNGRKAGLIDWSAIEDRTRHLDYLPTWRRPGDFMQDAYRWYREDWWRDQEVYPEVWIEKDALTGVIDGICHEYQVPYFACRGYVSQSEMYDAAQRLKRIARNRQPIILHLGDHDPSGLHMSVDNTERLDLLSRDVGIEVRRLALNMDQIDRYAPPPNPAKESDSRFREYAKIYGRKSWELDALDPDVIIELIRSEIEGMIDPDPWERCKEDQERRRAIIEVVADNWRAAVMAAHDVDGEVDQPDEDDI